VFEVDDHSLLSSNGQPKYVCVPDAADEGGTSGIVYELNGLSDEFLRSNHGDLSSGRSYIRVPGGRRDSKTSKLHVPPGAAVSMSSRKGGKNLRSSLRASRKMNVKKIGTSSVLILRVQTIDASVTSSSTALSNSVFGGGGDQVNLKSQYAECSNNQLIFNPAEGSLITNGVAEITVTVAAAGTSPYTIENAVTTQAQSVLGNLNQWDHIMYCLPPGTSGGWIAYGYLSWSRTVYNTPGAPT
jgi:hypothetical protein